MNPQLDLHENMWIQKQKSAEQKITSFVNSNGLQQIKGKDGGREAAAESHSVI